MAHVHWQKDVFRNLKEVQLNGFSIRDGWKNCKANNLLGMAPVEAQFFIMIWH